MSPEDFFPNYYNASGIGAALTGKKAKADEQARLKATQQQVEKWWPMVDSCEAADAAINGISAEIDKQKLVVQNPNSGSDQRRVATRLITAYAQRITEFRAQKKKLGCDAAEKAAKEKEMHAAVAQNNEPAKKITAMRVVAWSAGAIALGAMIFWVIKKSKKP